MSETRYLQMRHWDFWWSAYDIAGPAAFGGPRFPPYGMPTYAAIPAHQNDTLTFPVKYSKLV